MGPTGLKIRSTVNLLRYVARVQHRADVMDPGRGLDVVGLGALNIDLLAAPINGDQRPIEDKETLVTRDEIEERRRAESLVTAAFLGGSAFNAIVMLAQLRTSLRLGMAGISAEPDQGLTESHIDRLRSLDIADLTKPSEAWPGVCLGLSSPHGRQLWTAPEANLEIVDYLNESEQLRTWVAGARILHLSSLLERPADRTATSVSEAVASFVEVVKRENPELILSFDPGRTWVDALDRLPALHRIYAQADVVYADAQEYDVLADRANTHRRARARSLRGLCSATGSVILKFLDEIVVQHAGGFDLARIPRRQATLAVDPTGAGDAIAAGVLAALGEGRSVVEGCELGLRIAAHRVADYGDRGHAQLRASLGAVWHCETVAS